MPKANKRIVLITGATSGLGAETARQLAQRGWTVVLTGREAAAANASAETIRAEGGDAHPLRLDVNDADSVREAMQAIEQRWGRLDVLINNAGVMLDGRWTQNTAPTISEEVLHETFETNFFAVVRLTRAALPLLRRGSSPQVINVSSLAGSLTAHADLAGPLAAVKPFAYDASKAALNAFTIHLAAALSPDGIRVNSVHPGWVRTHMGNAAAPPGHESELVTVEAGAQPIVELAISIAPTPTAKFLQREGELPW